MKALSVVLLATLAACGTAPTTGYNASEADAATMTRYASAKTPPMDPKRKIDEQDCSKPVPPEGGNLRCR
ncbi:MAG TPA: hypothetical protein VFB08_21210 [Burkholderiales bacterium]|nr:hypothetical protein [Burkholderiales bacterium]